MTNFEGILGRIIKEKKDLFTNQFHAALMAKYETVDPLPHGVVTAMAKACGVKPMTIYLWRKGETFPNDRHVEKIAEFLGISVKKLLGSELFRYYREKGQESDD